jgi:hypothetical protein
MSDQAIIDEAVTQFQMGEPIDSLQARVIANAWHGGQWTALYSFASTGHIAAAETPELEWEIERLMEGRSRFPELNALLAYVRANGPRKPQAGWSNLHW